MFGKRELKRRIAARRLFGEGERWIDYDGKNNLGVRVQLSSVRIAGMALHWYDMISL